MIGYIQCLRDLTMLFNAGTRTRELAFVMQQKAVAMERRLEKL